MTPTQLPINARGKPQAEAPHQAILVREQDSQHSGSGCCGRLGERHSVFGKAADFSHSRVRMEQIGEIYRALSEAAPALDLVVADPRNFIWLYPSVWRAGRRHGLGVVAALRSMARAGSLIAIVLDGETLFAGSLPESREVVATVLARLDQHLDA